MERLLAEKIPLANSCNGRGTCGKCKVRILSGAVDEITAPEERLLSAEDIRAGYRLACMTRSTGDVLAVEVPEAEKEHVFTTDGFKPNIIPDNPRDGYGLAVDIGTTTVVVSLIDLRNGEEAATGAMINPQKIYGLDVLTRITYETETGVAGIAALQKAIVGGLNELAEKVCAERGIASDSLIEIDVAANCTMQHMLAGVDARPIGKSPYRPVFVKALRLKAKKLGLVGNDDTLVYLLPSVSAYIGADIVAGVHICDLKNTGDNALFIDIGTNIGDVPPVGLCGSGILAVVRELVRTGLVTKRGVFNKPENFDNDDWRKTMLHYNGTKREFTIHTGKTGKDLVVTQSDVRQVQLAKGAIRSGIEVLLGHAGLKAKDLDRVLIAGQFGAHLPAESLLEIGLLPPVSPDKLIYAGNSAKTGALSTLLSEKAKQETEDLAADIHYIELSNSENYDRLFAKCLLF